MFHRQFIAAVLAAAVAVTGMTAAPARADNDAAKVIAGVAALAVLGAAMSDAKAQGPPQGDLPLPTGLWAQQALYQTTASQGA
ncbi:MAG: hypothetical protein R8G60_11815 [Roseovarius pacificus]|nr:hypothetical protein [Roseovarius pacificus]